MATFLPECGNSAGKIRHSSIFYFYCMPVFGPKQKAKIRCHSKSPNYSNTVFSILLDDGFLGMCALMGKNVFQLHYKCILQNLSLNRQRQKGIPKGDKTLLKVLFSKLIMFEQRSKLCLPSFQQRRWFHISYCFNYN